MAYTVKFVSAVGESDAAHTRLDLTALDPPRDYRRVQVGDGADWGWPALSTVVAEGVGGDGDVPVASRYGNRTVTLPIVFTDLSTADQRRTALSVLARELDRDRNVLYVAADGASEGRWLITYRAAQAAADLRTWGPSDAGLAVTLTAEPFAYGALVTEIPWSLGGPGTSPGPGVTSTLLGLFRADLPASEGSAPSATAPGGQWYRQVDPAAVLGDVEAPLNLTFTPPPSGTIGDRSFLVASRPVRDDDTDLLRYHLTSTVGATVNAPNTTTDANSSSGDAARLPSTATLNSWYAVMYGHLPSIVGGAGSGKSRELRGRWRVYARTRIGTDGAVFELQAGMGGPINPSGAVADPNLRGLAKLALVSARATSTTFALLDLGLMELPVAGAAGSGPVVTPPAVREPLLGVFARRVAGTGTLDVDFLFAVPADGRTARIRAAGPLGPLPAPYQIAVDGEANTVQWRYTSGSETVDLPVVVPWEGALPRVSPRYPTQLFVVPELGDSAGISADLSKPLAVAATYRPRYLSVL